MRNSSLHSTIVFVSGRRVVIRSGSARLAKLIRLGFSKSIPRQSGLQSCRPCFAKPTASSVPLGTLALPGGRPTTVGQETRTPSRAGLRKDPKSLSSSPEKFLLKGLGLNRDFVAGEMWDQRKVLVAIARPAEFCGLSFKLGRCGGDFSEGRSPP